MLKNLKVVVEHMVEVESEIRPGNYFPDTETIELSVDRMVSTKNFGVSETLTGRIRVLAFAYCIEHELGLIYSHYSWGDKYKVSYHLNSMIKVMNDLIKNDPEMIEKIVITNFFPDSQIVKHGNGEFVCDERLYEVVYKHVSNVVEVTERMIKRDYYDARLSFVCLNDGSDACVVPTSIITESLGLNDYDWRSLTISDVRSEIKMNVINYDEIDCTHMCNLLLAPNQRVILHEESDAVYEKINGEKKYFNIIPVSSIEELKAELLLHNVCDPHKRHNLHHRRSKM